MERDEVRALMDEILERQGKGPTAAENESLRDLGFRSLDFSELALRVEDEIERELNFDAPTLRGIATVGEVLDFFDQAAGVGA